MRKYLFFVVAAVFSAGCEMTYVTSDYVFDDHVGIVVTDAAGNNLLDPAVESNILDNGITVKYNGEVYPLTNDENTRYAGSGSKVAWVGRYSHSDPVIALNFGNLYDGSRDLEELTIDWGDGTSDKVNFEYLVTWGWNKRGRTMSEEAVEHKMIWINDVLISDNSLMAGIVK